MRNKKGLQFAIVVGLGVGLTLAGYFSWRRRAEPKGRVEISTAPRIQWQFKADSRIFATPAIANDGTLYVSSYDVLYALNPDGSEKWHYFPGTHLWNSPIIGPNQSIYLFTWAGEVHALNPDGSRLWVSRVGYSSPGVQLAGTALVVSTWEVKTTPALCSGGLTGSGATVVATENGHLWTVDLESGETVSRLLASGTGESSPAVLPDGTVLQGTNTSHGALNAVSQDGRILWSVHSRGYSSFGSPAIAHDGTIVVSDSAESLHALDSSGRTKWELQGRWGLVPIITNTGIVLDDLDPQQFAAVAPDGSVMWKIQIFQPSPAAIAEDGTIYLVGKDSNGPGPASFAVALRPDGQVKWKVPIIGLSKAGPTIAPDGMIYFVTEGAGSEKAGFVYAIKENNGGLMKTGWPKFHGNLNNDGHAAMQAK